MKPTLIVAAVVAFSATAASAQGTYKKDIPDSLAKHAKVSEADAAATAQKRVPKGKIEGVELEREKGKLIYSFELKTEGKSGTDEVNVDAMIWQGRGRRARNRGHGEEGSGCGGKGSEEAGHEEAMTRN